MSDRTDPGTGTSRSDPGTGTSRSDPGTGTSRSDPGTGTSRFHSGLGAKRSDPNRTDRHPATDTSIALVVAQFYPALAAEITAEAIANAHARGAAVVAEVPVPGVYDAPLVADHVARRDAVDAIVVLGVVVTGDTDHDEVVSHACATLLGRVALDRDTPVAFGVLGPGMSGAEAEDRVEKAAAAVDAALDTHVAVQQAADIAIER